MPADAAAVNTSGADQRRSLWRATAPLAPATSTFEGRLETDVLVVGAGYTGLSCALTLAEAGRPVILLEAGDIGHGASGRNGGQVIPGLKHDPDDLVARFGRDRGETLVRLTGGAADRLFALVAKHHIDCAATQCGWIQPAHSAAAARRIIARTRQWTARGAPVELLTRDRLAQMLGTDVYTAGWLDHRAGALHPLAYARGLARAAIGHGARVHTGSPATRLVREDDAWVITTPRGQARARQVVLATDAYAGALWPELAVNQLLVTSVQIATDPLPEVDRRAILPGGTVASDTRELLYYFRLDPDGRFVIGGRGSVTESVPERVYAALRRAAAQMYPQLADVQWPYRWYGRVGITRDWLPHLAEVAPGVWAALGYCGRGVAMATTMGLVLADILNGGHLPAYPVVALKPIPLHALRRPLLRAAIAYYRVRDAMSQTHRGRRA
jgi:glycine/D-amino acid oxidase-like deaminating enzyme